MSCVATFLIISRRIFISLHQYFFLTIFMQWMILFVALEISYVATLVLAASSILGCSVTGVSLSQTDEETIARFAVLVCIFRQRQRIPLA